MNYTVDKDGFYGEFGGVVFPPASEDVILLMLGEPKLLRCGGMRSDQRTCCQESRAEEGGS